MSESAQPDHPSPDTPDPSAQLSTQPANAKAAYRSIGNYRLLRKLGEGGMGQVWLAEQTAPVRRQVALKLIRAGMYDDAMLQRFQSERQALAIMEHPSIAKIFDAGSTPEGQPYLVMEYVPGLPITDYCDRKDLSIQERLELFIQVCEGVQHAHQKSIMHRDLKPANILVIEVDGKPVPRIIDFGLAKARIPQGFGDPAVTLVGAPLGTPAYMSPEQADPECRDIDTRTDVYSLGVLLYELLTGALPFDPKQLQEKALAYVLRQIREEDALRPSMKFNKEASSHREAATTTAGHRNTDPVRLVKLLRGDLDWITMKAIEKDRSRRYGTPTELSADVSRYLRNEAVVAGPATAGYRLRKYAMRHRVALGATAAGVLLLSGFAVTQAVELRRIRLERDRANRVTDFMTGMFRVSDPSEARGNSITAREVLDKASADIGTSLAKDPELQGQMMYTMGDVYRNLGLSSRAETLLQSSSDIRKRALGSDNPETLRSMSDLAVVLEDEGRFADAEKLAREILDIDNRVLGPKSAQTLREKMTLADVLEDEGHYPEAEKLNREVLDVARRTVGPESQRVADCMTNLASVLRAEGKYAEAEQLDWQTLDLYRRVLGAEHPNALVLMNNLGNLLREEGRYADAEKMDRETIEIERRVLGPEHPNTLGSTTNLAEVLQEEGRLAEAETLSRQTLDVKRRVNGLQHPSTLRAMAVLAGTLELEGKYAEAEKLNREALEAQQRVLGPEHPETLYSADRLAAVLVDEGREAEGERLERETLESARRVLGPEHAESLMFTTNLAEILLREGKYAEAEKLDQSALEVERKVLGPEDPETASTTYNLGCIATRKGQRDRAFSFLRDAVDHGLPPSEDLGIDKDPDLKSLRKDPRFAALVAHAKERAAELQKLK